MEPAHEAIADDRDSAAANNRDDATESRDLEPTPPTTLMEITPGIAVLFGEVPEGVELVDLDLVPSFNWTQFSTALGSIGNASTIAGNLTEAASSARGLYRVNDATYSLLKSGGELAAKDGAKLGGILKDGKVIAQARFIPTSMTAATAVAAIGPAIAMLALQMQLGEISGLVQTNIALTTQTLKSIRNDQWSEVEGVATSVDAEFNRARICGAVTETAWDTIATNSATINKHIDLYQKSIAEHIQELRNANDIAQSHYLKSNATAIAFDVYAMLRSLKTYAEYNAFRAAVSHKRSATSEEELQSFEHITHSIPSEIEDHIKKIRELTGSLIPELKIIAELRGRSTIPFSKNRKNAEEAVSRSRKILEIIEPLAHRFYPPIDTPQVPGVVCAPEGLDLDPYLHALQFRVKRDEALRGLAFPYATGNQDFTKIRAKVLARQIDTAWTTLGTRKIDDIGEKFVSSTFVAITDQRIITANPKKFLRQGELASAHSLDTVRHVRPPSSHDNPVRRMITVTTDSKDIHWMFPDAATDESIDNLVALLSEASGSPDTSPAEIEQADSANPAVSS